MNVNPVQQSANNETFQWRPKATNTADSELSHYMAVVHLSTVRVNHWDATTKHAVNIERFSKISR